MPAATAAGSNARVESPPAYLTVVEVACLARCEHKAVRRAIHAGDLQAFQPANKLLVRKQDAHAWIQSRPPRLAAQPSPRPPRPPRPSNRRAATGSVAKLRELEQLAFESVKSV